MNKLRYLVLGAVALLAGVGLWAGLHAGGADDAQPADATPPDATQPVSFTCPTCAAGKTAIPKDPEKREAVMKRLLEEAVARQEAAGEINRQLRTRWKGCTFVPAAKPENKAEFDRQNEVAELFKAKQPIPQARLDKFKRTLSSPDCVCVGWQATVSRVVDTEGGKTIELVVTPALATKGGGFLHTLYKCRETWKLDGQDNLVLEKIEGVPGTGEILSSP